MAMLQGFSSKHCEKRTRRWHNFKNLPAIDENNDKRDYKGWNPNEEDNYQLKIRVSHRQDFSQTYISLKCLVNFIFFDVFKYAVDNVQINMRKPRNDNVDAENYLYELKGGRVFLQDWLNKKCLIFVRETILVYERLIFYVPVYISSNEDLLFKQKSQELIDKLTEENEDVKKRNISLEQKLKERTIRFNDEKIKLSQEKDELMDENRFLKNELRELKTKYEQLKLENQETLHDLGKLSVERATDVNRTKKANALQKTFKLKKFPTNVMLSNENASSSTSKCDEAIRGEILHCEHDNGLPCNSLKSNNKLPDLLIPASTSYQQSNNSKEDSAATLFAEAPVKKNEASAENHNVYEIPGHIAVTTDNRNVSGHLSFPVKVTEPRDSEFSSLIDYEGCSVITAEMRNVYKMLLLTIADRLLPSDIVKLKEWANERFSIQTNLGATEIMFRLDQIGAISAFDLNQLHSFFESILRFDLIYLIDQFSSGDYPCLRKLIFSISRRNESQTCNSNQVHWSAVSNTYSIPKRPFYTRRNADVVSHDDQAGANQRENISHARNPTSSDMPTTSKTHVMTETSASTNDRTAQNTRKHCNGTSHSSPDNSQSSRKHDVHEEKWLCSHYKRRCYVKFECCNKFWPCHRCHNNESNCGRRKLKSRDTKMVKCTECGEEQQFGENNQFCISCNVKFADFYCGSCKHLTGMDDYPYHCNKCGICRIHGDRSFHCDVCGVCLDVKLRGNHKCREGSAHDECFICMEDAFTGCQILPCSHKVHKNCATQMIQRGITRCPVCRESFAHMLTKGSSAKKNTKKR